MVFVIYKSKRNIRKCWQVWYKEENFKTEKSLKTWNNLQIRHTIKDENQFLQTSNIDPKIDIERLLGIKVAVMISSLLFNKEVVVNPQKLEGKERIWFKVLNMNMN